MKIYFDDKLFSTQACIFCCHSLKNIFRFVKLIGQDNTGKVAL